MNILFKHKILSTYIDNSTQIINYSPNCNPVQIKTTLLFVDSKNNYKSIKVLHIYINCYFYNILLKSRNFTLFKTSK